MRDEESFARNTLAAGNLDLKLDWEEHYYRGGGTAAAGLTNDIVYVGGDPTNVPEGYVGLPTTETPSIAVATEDLPQFMANTAIEAYPDVDDDGIKEPFADEPGETTADGVGYICADGADADDLDPTAEDSLRTMSADTYDTATGTAKPLFALEDVKPGDFGELTLSYHLCDTRDSSGWTAPSSRTASTGSPNPSATTPPTPRARRASSSTPSAPGSGTTTATTSPRSAARTRPGSPPNSPCVTCSRRSARTGSCSVPVAAPTAGSRSAPPNPTTTPSTRAVRR